MFRPRCLFPSLPAAIQAAVGGKPDLKIAHGSPTALHRDTPAAARPPVNRRLPLQSLRVPPPVGATSSLVACGPWSEPRCMWTLVNDRGDSFADGMPEGGGGGAHWVEGPSGRPAPGGDRPAAHAGPPRRCGRTAGAARHRVLQSATCVMHSAFARQGSTLHVLFAASHSFACEIPLGEAAQLLGRGRLRYERGSASAGTSQSASSV